MTIPDRLGHYEVSASIGSGTMGRVYRARDTKLGREVALKLLPTTLCHPQNLDRFRREAKALAALNHPNIVTVYSIEETDETPFLTMELVEGQTLDHLISADGLDLSTFQDIALQLTHALTAAHSKGIVHRDLKPANIVVTHDGRLKVLDFGLARILSEQPVTDANVTVGTAAYMSPEQISGGVVDGRSDIFSLGVILYELISGRRPFRGDHSAALMYSIVNEEAPRVSCEPTVLADIVDKCLRKDPAERFETAHELRLALESHTGTPRSDRTTASPGAGSEARSAFARGDLTAAHELLREAQERRALDPGEMEMLATAANWLGEIDECIQTRERAYAIYTKASQQRDAARVALELMSNYRHGRTSESAARGWQMRAERLLEAIPECSEHGWLLRWQASEALRKGDFDNAVSLNEKCMNIATSYTDADLQTTALHDRGQILIAQGEVESGSALIDEAMTAALAGELNPITVGVLCCRTLSVCESLADFDRAGEWSEVASRWCEPFGSNVFRGICRVHNAEAMRHHGKWREAEEALRSSSEHFINNGHRLHAGEALYQLGELGVLQGRYAEAEDAFHRAHELGRDPVPGLPWLRLAQGQGEAARKLIDRALAEMTGQRLERARLLATAAMIALANDDVPVAKSAVDELTATAGDFNSPCFKAHALLGYGSIELHGGRHQSASVTLRKAWSIFTELNFPFDAARTRVLLAKSYLGVDNTEDARMQLQAARKTFQQLGAQPDLEIANDLIAKLA